MRNSREMLMTARWSTENGEKMICMLWFVKRMQVPLTIDEVVEIFISISVSCQRTDEFEEIIPIILLCKLPLLARTPPEGNMSLLSVWSAAKSSELPSQSVTWQVTQTRITRNVSNLVLLIFYAWIIHSPILSHISWT